MRSTDFIIGKLYIHNSRVNNNENNTDPQHVLGPEIKTIYFFGGIKFSSENFMGRTLVRL